MFAFHILGLSLERNADVCRIGELPGVLFDKLPIKERCLCRDRKGARAGGKDGGVAAAICHTSSAERFRHSSQKLGIVLGLITLTAGQADGSASNAITVKVLNHRI